MVSSSSPQLNIGHGKLTVNNSAVAENKKKTSDGESSERTQL